MFEIKGNKNNSEFAKYLEEKKKNLVITKLNDQEYQTFQNEVLDTLNTINTLLTDIEVFLSTKDNQESFDTNEMKAKIYNRYLELNNSSTYFKDIINELITSIDNRSFSSYLVLIRDIRNRVDKIKDEFFRESRQRVNLLSVVSPETSINETNEAFENKYLLYRELIKLTSKFSKSFNMLEISNYPEFLARFYRKYKEASDSYCVSEQKMLEELKNEVLSDVELIKYFGQIRNDFSQINSELSEDIFKSKKLKPIYTLVETHIESLIELGICQSENFIKEYKKVMKSSRNKGLKDIIASTDRDVFKESYNLTNRVNKTIDRYLDYASNSLRFLDDGVKYKLPYMEDEELEDAMENAWFLELFYQAYREIPGISLTDQELIELIKYYNKKKIRKYVKKLIACLDNYFEPEVDEKSLTTYYDCMKNARNLTEQEVIDHVVKKVLDSTHKS